MNKYARYALLSFAGLAATVSSYPLTRTILNGIVLRVKTNTNEAYFSGNTDMLAVELSQLLNRSPTVLFSAHAILTAIFLIVAVYSVCKIIITKKETRDNGYNSTSCNGTPKIKNDREN